MLTVNMYSHCHAGVVLVSLLKGERSLCNFVLVTEGRSSCLCTVALRQQSLRWAQASTFQVGLLSVLPLTSGSNRSGFLL